MTRSELALIRIALRQRRAAEPSEAEEIDRILERLYNLESLTVKAH